MLHLYEKPKAGNGFLGRFTAQNYKHRISAVGWFDSATCDIIPRSRAAPEQFVDQYLGNRVAIYVDNPAEPVWEGFVNRLTFNQGSTVFTISLDEMMNRVSVKNTAPTDTIVTTTAPDIVSSLASQSVYGIKAGALDLGFFRVAGTRAATIASTKLAQLCWPQQSITLGSGVPGVIHLEMLGFYHTLKWEERIETAAGAADLKTYITSASFGVLPPLLNGATFFDNTDFTDIAANATTSPVNELRGKTPWDHLVEIQEIGDTSKNYYVVGISPTDFITGKRRLYYRTANNVVEYSALMRDELRPRDLTRRLIPPWLVKPNRAIRVTDWVVGGAIQGDDPRETYIMSVDYDANAQRVTLTGDDAKTAEAAFQLHQKTKRFGRRFGASSYSQVTA
jgi:hypothetical protein